MANKPSAPLSERTTQPVSAPDGKGPTAPEEGAPAEGAALSADAIEAAQEAARKSAAARALRDQRQKAEQREAAKRRRRRRKIAVTATVLLLVVVTSAVAAAFSWFRWFSADDLTDIKGTWYLAGTNTPITITNDRIQLTENVAYRYAIDPQEKTITFSFGSKEGSGFYRFSLDRDQLALVDGEFSGADTLMGDFAWTVEALMRYLSNEDLAPSPPGAGVTLLSREPARGSAPVAVDPSQALSGQGDGTASDGLGSAGQGGDASHDQAPATSDDGVSTQPSDADDADAAKPAAQGDNADAAKPAAQGDDADNAEPASQGDDAASTPPFDADDAAA